MLCRLIQIMLNEVWSSVYQLVRIAYVLLLNFLELNLNILRQPLSRMVTLNNFWIAFFNPTLLVAGKREPEQELEAQQWIESILGERFPAHVPYEEALRDGILLCRLMNALQPGTIPRINFSGGDYKMMDNLSQFQKACVAYGVPDVDLFQTVDLWDKKDIARVTMTIFAIGRTAYKHPEWRGPCLGPRPAEENRRDFTEDQLRGGEKVIGLQAGSNKGATQAGQYFGMSRKILLGK